MPTVPARSGESVVLYPALTLHHWLKDTKSWEVEEQSCLDTKNTGLKKCYIRASGVFSTCVCVHVQVFLFSCACVVQIHVQMHVTPLPSPNKRL